MLDAKTTIAQLAELIMAEAKARACTKIAVACSGGLDSRFLCHILKKENLPLLALHIYGPHVPDNETRYATEWCEKQQITMQLVNLNPVTDLNIQKNDQKRCYYCKVALIKAFQGYLQNLPEKYLLCDGTNADDLLIWRPGTQALKEYGVFSPLATAKLTKADIRFLAEQSGMENPNQVARPCLLTRFAYNVTPDQGLLQRLEATEADIEDFLLKNGEQIDFRLRITPAPLLQIQKLQAEWEKEIKAIITRYGFNDCTIQVGDKISGYYDQQH